MNKLLKGVGVFILASLMFLTSINTQVFAENTQAPVTYKIGSQTYYWYGKEDITLPMNATAIFTLNDNISTEHSVKIPYNTSVLVNGGNYTWTYTNTVNSELAGMFRLLSNSSRMTFYSGTFKTSKDAYAPIVSGLTGASSAAYCGSVTVNGGTFKRENANATYAMFDYVSRLQVNAGIFSGADETNKNLFYYGSWQQAGSASYSDINLSNCTIKNFYTAVNATNTRTNNGDISIWNNVKFENNTIDFQLGKQIVVFDISYLDSLLTESKTVLKVYRSDEDMAGMGQISSKILDKYDDRFGLKSMNSNYEVSKNTDNHFYYFEKKFDATDATYTSSGNTLTATFGSKTKTLTFDAMDMVKTNSSDTSAYDPDKYCSIVNGIPGTTYKITYATKSGDTYGEASETAPSAVGNYKAILQLYSGDTAIKDAKIEREFKIVSDFDFNSATYSVENNIIKATVTKDESNTAISFISLGAEDAEYTGSAYDANKHVKIGNKEALNGLANLTTNPATYSLTYKTKDAEDSTYSSTAPTNVGSYTVKLTLSSKQTENTPSTTDSEGSTSTSNGLPVSITANFNITEATSTITPTDNSGTGFDTSEVTYSSTSNTITATDKNGVTISLSILDAHDADYTGKPYAGLDLLDEFSANGLAYTILYTGNNGYSSSQAPTEPGTYTVTITAGGKTITKTFTINGTNDYCAKKNGSNYVWSSSKKGCVYKVTNTGNK